MSKRKLKKLLILNLPYVLIGLFATNVGEIWRMAAGENAAEKVQSIVLDGLIMEAFSNPLPSLHPLDLLIGIAVGVILRVAVYIKGKNAKNYRHNVEYGSARWGTRADIEPFEDSKFANNVILSQTERITMNSRPSQPKYARNKNVLIVGGSGSGKTRFWLKPNLLQMHSSYVVTDPKGTLLPETGTVLYKNGYEIKVFKGRLVEIAALKKHIINYSKTRDTYAEYRKSGYSKKFFEEHREAITLCKAAKEAFSQIEGKLPTIRELNAKYNQVLQEKKKTYAEYRKAKQDMKDLQTAKYNVDRLLKFEQSKEQDEKQKTTEQTL